MLRFKPPHVDRFRRQCGLCTIAAQHAVARKKKLATYAANEKRSASGGFAPMGTPRYSDRLCSDRRYSDNAQSRRRKDADEPNPENQGQYNCVGTWKCFY